METLYHGTTKRAFEQIKVEGIQPRGLSKSNWEKGIGKSRPDLVYLTSCYACYYASSACKRKDDIPVILKVEIDPTKIKLYPDEEFLFQSVRQSIDEPDKAVELYESIDPKDTSNYISNKTGKEVRWQDSLNYMGTVTASFIPVECIIGYAEGTSIEFIMNCDPSVSPLNYRFCSEGYINYLESLEYAKVDNK